MRLLFDENISYRILKKLANDYPDSAQVKRLGLESKDDHEIWQFAKEEGFTIVTFDADYIDIAALKGHPPKIIWLRLGNTTTDAIALVLKLRKSEIIDFHYEKEFEGIACLEII